MSRGVIFYVEGRVAVAVAGPLWIERSLTGSEVADIMLACRARSVRP